MPTRRVPNPQPEYLSIAKAAALYDVSETFLRRRINQGQLSAVRCGRQIIRIGAADLARSCSARSRARTTSDDSLRRRAELDLREGVPGYPCCRD